MKMSEGYTTMETFLRDGEAVEPVRLARSIRVALLALFAALLAFAVLPAAAFAATASVSIPVEQIFSAQAGAASSGIFNYVLTPRNVGQPMPAASVNNAYTFSITGSTTRTIVIDGFSSAGYFFYDLRPEERAPNEFYTLDNTVYTLIIAVTNNAGGGVTARLHAIVVGTEVTEAAKREYIIYEKAFDDDETGVDTGNDTGNDGGTGNDSGTTGGGGTTTGGGPSPGPKTGDDSLHPTTLMAAMVISAVIALFALLLIYVDRKSEEAHGGIVT